MRIETFRQRLQEGKSVGYHYESDGMSGIIGIWRHEEKFVLTSEEFPKGDVFNEQNYTRDEVHSFQNVEAIIKFLKVNNLNPTQFRP